MPRVRVAPADFVLDVDVGETLLSGARRAGVRWPSVCGGFAQCRTCWFQVQEGASALAPAEPLEAAALALLAPTLSDPASARLACQAKVLGDLAVGKVGARRPDLT